ncbi:MAG TPA: RDD family protein [Dermatophilaceae bacterium]
MSETGPGAGTSPGSGDAVPRRVDAVPRRVDAVPAEARPFQGQRAGIVTRTVANVVDFSLVVGVIAGGYAAWAAVTFLINPTRFSFPEPSFLLLLLCYGVLLFVYLMVSWATTGRTYGDHLLGLRVVNFRGERMRWAGAVVRSAFCVVLPIGLYWAVLSPKNRSVQDAVLRTSVIYDWTIGRRAASPITPPAAGSAP